MEASTMLRVHLIEDNPADAELTLETLEEEKLLIHTTVSSDGESALKLLRGFASESAQLPHVILLDLNLPGLSGGEVLKNLRADPALRKIPVVILTSSDAEADIVRSYELGANCYVTKPVGLREFQRIVQSIQSFWFTVVKLP